MFNNERYLTRGINEEVNIAIQTALWNLIDNLKLENNIELDYLQVFELRAIKKSNRFNQEIIHSQEQPFYKKRYLVSVENPIKAKIYVIDDGASATTMLLAEEY